MRTKRFQLFVAILLVGASLARLTPPQPVTAAASGYDLVAAVNALRQSKGLQPLKVDSALMNSAQGHSDYQASIGAWTHTGPGGSTPTSRGAAAGFGGGASIFVSENVALTANSADLGYVLYSVWTDALHWGTMINPKYTHAGGGVTVKGGRTYYTLDVGYISGQAGSIQPTSGAAQPSASSARLALAQVASPTVVLVEPVITSTPNPDGSIFHPVQFGQVLINIAKAYGLSLDELKKRNNLASDIIFAGKKLLIQGSSTPTLKPTITLTPIPPTRTATFTRTPTLPPSSTPLPTATPTATPAPLIPSLDSLDQKTIGEVILGISAVGLVVVLVSLFLKKKS